MKMWKHYFMWFKPIYKGWSFETQLSKMSTLQYGIGIQLHADFNKEFEFHHRFLQLEIQFIKFYFQMQIYDHSHGE